MAKRKRTTDDLQPVAHAPVGEAPTEVLGGRLDHGETAQHADLESLEEFPFDEPLELVDAPAQLREPLTRTQKRRNQRR